MRVQKKPVIVNAWLIKDLFALDELDELENIDSRLTEAYLQGIINFDYANKELRIKTLEGYMTGPSEWYLICGVKGEFYPCDPEVFKESYEILDGD
jgi:hypothetical protein